MGIPETRYARTKDGVHIAYQVLGAGPVDLVYVNSSFTSDVELMWEWAPYAEWLRGLSAHGRLIVFDRRGTGLSDGVTADALPSLDARMDDIRAVMDAAGSERAVLFVIEDGAAPGFLFAATYPERVLGLMTWSSQAKGTRAPDYPFGWTDAEWDVHLAKIEAGFGTPDWTQQWVDWLLPGMAGDAELVRQFGRLIRHSLSPAAALAVERMVRELDVRHLLPAIQCPTWVLQPATGPLASSDEGRYLADHIAGARLIEVSGSDELSLVPLGHLRDLLASVRDEQLVFDRVLATVLFTDIVGSTEIASRLGDHKWRELVLEHNAKCRALIGRFRGREVDNAGDGFFATFDGPARAVRCAQAIGEAVEPLGLQIRAGLHTGEVETIGDKAGGIAVVIGARVASHAGAGEVLVSSTVKELVAGSGLTFFDLGEHTLKGVSDPVRIYRVAT
jgi:class 3 adenylate cyclase